MNSNKQRVIFYIDGFNFYFGLKSRKWKRFYWLEIVKFCQSFVRGHQELMEVNYFSAIPKNQGKHDRQDLFFSANRLNPKFNLILGKYLEKKVTFDNKQYKTYEEKQTDVNIAVKMIRDVIYDKCDISILISADSDLIPPIDFIREYKPNHKIFVYFPPNRHSFDLKNKANKAISLEKYKTRFNDALLPDEVTLPNGFVLKRPIKWN